MTPDRWLVLSVRIPSVHRDDLVADTLLGLGGLAVEERDDVYVTHLPPPPDEDDFLAEARRRIVALPGIDDAKLDARWQPHEVWEELWKEGLGSRRVTERIVVAPTWIEPEAGPGDIVVRLDPGMAFGTAEHATTRGCLRLLDGCLSAGDRVVDLGAGTAILSIVAARLGAAGVTAVEADPAACGEARKNVEANGVDDRVRIVEARFDAAEVAALGPVDGIAANIDSDGLLRLMPGFAPPLAPGGWLVLGGVLLGQQEPIVRAAEARGFDLETEDGEDEWWSGRFRPSASA